MIGTWIKQFADVWKNFKADISSLDVKGILDENNLSVWEDLFIGKLVPHLEGEGCLVVAVAGGTNTGKSTILNVLMNEEFTAVHYLASATKRPVLIASRKRVNQCLTNTMFLKFEAKRMEDKEDAIKDTMPNNILLVKEENLPDTYLYLDTPDVDSIAKEHWEVAESIVSAGDIIIAVITDMKYKDEAVVRFFRRAYEEGKIVVPLMNKVKTDCPDFLQIADEQVKDFVKVVGIDEDQPCFYFPEYRYGEKVLGKPIKPLNRDISDLRDYIRSFPVIETKTKIMQKTIEKFKEKFANWYHNEFIEQLQIFKTSIMFIEEQLKSEVIDKDFIPFKGIEFGENIKDEIKKQMGRWKYYLLYPTSIFSYEKKEINRIEIQEKHNLMIESCFVKYLDYLRDKIFVFGESIEKELKKQLFQLSDNRDKVLKSILVKMENILSSNPEWIREEIKDIVREFLNSPDLKGLYGRRLLSFLLFGVGTVSLFIGFPWMGPWKEILTGAGMLGGSAVVEIVGYEKFKERVQTLYENWLAEKRMELSQILKEEVLQYVLNNIYKYIESAEQFDAGICRIFEQEKIPIGETAMLHEFIGTDKEEETDVAYEDIGKYN